MKCFFSRAAAFCAVSVLLVSLSVRAQEMIPLPLAQRTQAAAAIAVGRIAEQQAYEGAGKNIYTLHKVLVEASAKMPIASEIYVVTPGGVLGNRATVVQPSIGLQKGAEYLFFLEGEETVASNRQLQRNSVRQYRIYSYPQGALPYSNGSYGDFAEGRKSERDLLAEIEALAGQPLRTPAGQRFQARLGSSAQRTMAITSFSSSSTRAGTIKPADYLTINGSGFGATAGNVFFANANNGGSNMIAPPDASDYVSWTDNQIVVKVPSQAGTGSFSVVGASTFNSPSSLTIPYALNDIYSSFYNFSTTTRQLPHLVNKNGLGGYTFLYNTTSGFATNTSAVAAVERALASWRTGTAVNFRSGGSTTLINAADGNNVILFGTLPAGVLGQTTTNYSGSAIPSSCEQQNTVWYISDIDMVYATPPTASTTWQFGPAAPSASQYDFESVVLHELGHAHNLGHVIAPGQVMHYAIANGQTARTLSANDIAAGTEMMAWSSSLCFNPSGVLGPMTPASATLPVRLLSFNGRRLTEAVNLLEWETAAEQNSKGFLVQRSLDGNNFQDIGFVNSKNPAGAAYEFRDEKAGRQSWRYRLKQLDLDGRTIYSGVLEITAENPAIDAWTNGSLLYIRLAAPVAAGAQVQVYGSDGKLLLRRNLTAAYTELSLPRTGGTVLYRIEAGGRYLSGKALLP